MQKPRLFPRKQIPLVTSAADLLGLLSAGAGSQALDAILHGLEEGPVVAVLSKRPSHDTTQALGGDDVGELLGDQLGGVKGPEETSLGVDVPLAAVLSVSGAVGDGLSEGLGGGLLVAIRAGSVRALATSGAVGGGVTAEPVLGAAGTASSGTSALEQGAGATRSVGGGSQGAGVDLDGEGGGLEGGGARSAGVLALGVLSQGKRAADGLGAGGVGGESEVLGVEGDSEVQLGGRETAVEVGLDSVEGALDVGVVLCEVVAAVEQVVAHDVDDVNSLVNQRNGLGSVGDHVALKAGHSNGQLPVADGLLDRAEQLREGLDLGDEVRVGDLLVVVAVASGVLVVDVDAVEAVSIHGGCNVAGVEGSRLLGGQALAEALGVAPTSNSQADLGSIVEHGADVREVHEGGVGANGVRGEERRVGKGGDDMSDAGSQRLVGQDCGVIPVFCCQSHSPACIYLFYEISNLLVKVEGISRRSRSVGSAGSGTNCAQPGGKSRGANHDGQ